MSAVDTTSARERLRELFAPEGSALDLAVFRISIAIFLAWNESVAIADASASLPEAVRVAPLGVGWLLPLVPITPALVRGARWVLWTACVTGGVGLFARTSFAIASLAAFYVMLAPQLGGFTFHDHHLLWLAVILAASPCGDALSVDAWLARRAGRPLPSRGRAHGLAIRVAWIVLGCVFFFPGVHKLTGAGLAWITGDNLRNQMWWKWAQDEATQPSFRIDRYPFLMHAGAGATVLFELAFLPLVLHRRTRALAVIGALLFHAATEYFMGIRFTVLWVMYGVFVPWEALLARVRKPRGVASSVTRSLAPTLAITTPLLAGIVIAGVAGATNAYPFACYPTFEHVPPDRMPALELAVDGTPMDRALWRDPGPREWALEWSVAGVYDAFDAARLDAYVRERLGARPSLAARVAGRPIVASRVSISVDPDHRFDVIERVPLTTIDP